MPNQTETKPSFFQPIGNTKPYFKAAFEGEAGTGKSWTVALVAIGLHKKIKSKKPIAIIDTEKASKFLIALFKENGIEAVVKETQSLADVKAAIDMCSEGFADILIIDSISHIWADFQEAYKRRLGRTTFQIQDWMLIKSEWNKNMSIPLVQSPIHMLVTGRVSDRMEQDTNEETGKKEFTKTGVKMQAEKNLAYEFDLLVLMERHELLAKKAREVWRQATILKGRGNLLDGAVFKNPTYDDFAPAIDSIIADPVETKGTPTDAGILITPEENNKKFFKDRDIALEKIEAILTKAWPGTSAENKKNKIEAVELAFKTTSWTEVTTLTPEILNVGIALLETFVAAKTKPSV